jgi:hypothetical protein
MGERQQWPLEPTFQRAVKVAARSDRLTSDGGAILLREADHRLGLVESLAGRLTDPRRQDLIRYTLVELIRFRLDALAPGYSAQHDLDRLCHDPALKLAVWDRSGEQTAEERLSSQPTQSRLIDILAHDHSNREAVRDVLSNGLQRWVRATGDDRRDGFLHALLRQGNAHTADGIRRFLRIVLVRARALAWSLDVPLDAGFTEGPVLDDLTDKNVRFVGRLKSNAVVEELAAPHLWRPAGRPPPPGGSSAAEVR